MRYRPLGDSGIEVSEISLGSWLTFGAGIGDDAARACVDAAFDVGINFIDTANVYGRGAAEEFLGEVLADRPRDSYVLATKAFFPMSNTDQGLSRRQIFKQIDASLARLRTDYVDLYQCHRYDVETPLEETMEALTEIVRAGKARHIGFSEWNAEQITAALDLVPGVEKFVSSQPQYSLLWREPERRRVPALRGERDLPDRLVAPRPGRAHRQVPARSGRRPRTRVWPSDRMNWWMHRYNDDVLARVQRLRPIAERLGISMAQLALAWVPARAECGVGDHRRLAPGAGARERRRFGDRARRGDARGDRRRASGVRAATPETGGCDRRGA